MVGKSSGIKEGREEWGIGHPEGTYMSAKWLVVIIYIYVSGVHNFNKLK